MAQDFRYQHLRSREAGRLPSVTEIREGELAVNLADEKIYLKNINNQIVGFITDKQVDAKIAAQSGASEEKIDALSGNVNTLNNKVDSMSGTVNTELASKVNTSTYNTFTANTNTALNNKADVSTTYTKTEVDTALGNKVNNTTYNTFTANTNTALASKVNTTTYDTFTADTNTALGNKADKNNVYTKTEVDTELGKKVNASTYNTFTANTNTALASKANANDVYTKTQVDTSIANFFDEAEYNSSTKKIIFKHGTTQKAEIDATDFIKDGMVSNVEIKDVQGTTCLVITFNTDSGKEPINIPISNIFDASNYYTKAEVDTSLSTKANKNDVYTKTETNTAINNATSGKVDTTAFNTYSADTDTKINGKVDNSTYNTYTAATRDEIASKANASDVYTKTETDTKITSATSGKVDTSTFNSYSSATDTKINSKVDATTYGTFTANTNTALGNKVDNSTYNTYTAATETTINGKLNTTDFNSYSAATKNVIDSKANAADVPTTATTYTKDEVNSAITSATSGKVDTTTYNTFTANTNTALSNKADSSALTTVETALNTHTADTVTHITSQERTSWNNKLDPTALDDYYDKDYINDNEQVIASALNDLEERKLDASAYTPTDLSNYYQKSETSGKSEISTALNLKTNTSDFNTHTGNTSIHHTHNNKSILDAITGNVGTMAYQNTNSYSSATQVNTALGTKANATDIPSVTEYADSVKYNSTSHYVEFYHGTTAGTKVFEYDASPFIVDGMVQNVEIKDVQGVICLVVSFNTDAGKQDINIPLTQIFDPSNYYDKDDIDTLVGSGFTSSSITDVIIENEKIVSASLTDLDERKLDASAYTPTDLSNYYTKSETSGATEISTALSLKANASDLNTHTADATVHFTTGTVQTQIDNSISGKVNTSDIISAITPSNSGSTAPIATKVVAENELVMSNALNDLDDRKLDASAYTPTDLSNYYQKSETSGATEISAALSLKADKSDLDGLKLKKLTQAEYDALVTKDANTLYVII